MQMAQAGITSFGRSASHVADVLRIHRQQEGKRQPKLQGNREWQCDGRFQCMTDSLSMDAAYYFLSYCVQEGCRHS